MSLHTSPISNGQPSSPDIPHPSFSAENATSSIFKRFYQSHFIRLLAIGGAGVLLGHVISALSRTELVILGIKLLPIPALYAALFSATALTAYYVYSRRNELVYEISLWRTVFIHYWNAPHPTWYHQINARLFLGAQPMLNLNHPTELQQEGITHILTLLEPEHEFATTLLTEPVQSTQWHSMGIEQQILPSPDFLPVSQDNLDRGVEHLHTVFMQDDTAAYVHCKAGRGRSASVVICYLLKYGIDGQQFHTVDEAISFVRSKRNCININREQRAALEIYKQRLDRSLGS